MLSKLILLVFDIVVLTNYQFTYLFLLIILIHFGLLIIVILLLVNPLWSSILKLFYEL